MAIKFDVKSTTNLFVAVAVVAVILMLIIPLPTVLLDFLMACNVLLSVLIILITLYTPKSTDFSTFPTILLVSTVFSLALNVSSTRLILSKGSDFDGKMVTAFGEFVVGSGGAEGLLIGIVIFIIADVAIMSVTPTLLIICGFSLPMYLLIKLTFKKYYVVYIRTHKEKE